MTTKACLVCGSLGPWVGSRCPRHQRAGRWNHANASATARGYGWAWTAIRKRVLREEPNCRCGRRASEVDHIIPKAEGGTNERSNLQALCSVCHRTKTMTEAARGSRRAHG